MSPFVRITDSILPTRLRPLVDVGIIALTGLIKEINSCSTVFRLKRIPHPTSNTLLVPIIMVLGSTSMSGLMFSG